MTIKNPGCLLLPKLQTGSHLFGSLSEEAVLSDQPQRLRGLPTLCRHTTIRVELRASDGQLGSNANVADGGIRKGTRSDEIRPIIRPPLRPKRAASGVAGLRYVSGQGKTNHALMSEMSAETSARSYST